MLPPESISMVEVGPPDVATLTRFIEIRDQRILHLEAEAQRLEARWQQVFDELTARHASCEPKMERLRAETTALQRTLARSRDDITRLQQRISELEAGSERQNAALAEAIGARRESESRHAAAVQRSERIEHSNAMLRQVIRDLQPVLDQVGAQIVHGQTVIKRADLDGNHATT